MDLGAFLLPGGSYSIKIKAKDAAEECRGQVEAHRGRPFWTAESPQPAGRVLNITVEMAGFSLAGDGSLIQAGPAARAYVVMIGQVKGCRFIPSWKLYALRLKLLGRLWP